MPSASAPTPNALAPEAVAVVFAPTEVEEKPFACALEPAASAPLAVASEPAPATAPADPLGALASDDAAVQKKAQEEARAKARAEARAKAKAEAEAKAKAKADAARAAEARRAESAKPTYVPPPAPTPAAAPAAPEVPKDVCGGRVFIALLSCLKNECQDPVKAKHPRCVEFLEAERRREQQNQFR